MKRKPDISDLLRQRLVDMLRDAGFPYPESLGDEMYDLAIAEGERIRRASGRER